MFERHWRRLFMLIKITFFLLVYTCKRTYVSFLHNTRQLVHLECFFFLFCEIKPSLWHVANKSSGIKAAPYPIHCSIHPPATSPHTFLVYLHLHVTIVCPHHNPTLACAKQPVRDCNVHRQHKKASKQVRRTSGFPYRIAYSTPNTRRKIPHSSDVGHPPGTRQDYSTLPFSNERCTFGVPHSHSSASPISVRVPHSSCIWYRFWRCLSPNPNNNGLAWGFWCDPPTVY